MKKLLIGSLSLLTNEMGVQSSQAAVQSAAPATAQLDTQGTESHGHKNDHQMKSGLNYLGLADPKFMSNSKGNMLS